MNARRLIFALGLLALAVLLVMVAMTPTSENARPLLLGAAVVSVAAILVLFVWRTIGSLLALISGALASMAGIGIGFASGFSGAQVKPEVSALAYVGLGVGLFAIIDLIARLIAGAARGE